METEFVLLEFVAFLSLCCEFSLVQWTVVADLLLLVDGCFIVCFCVIRPFYVFAI